MSLAMKQYSEQQAKNRDNNCNSMTQPIQPQLITPSPYNCFLHPRANLFPGMDAQSLPNTQLPAPPRAQVIIVEVYIIALKLNADNT